MESRRQDWVFRLSNELKRASSAKFVTLTYAPESMPISSVEIDGICYDYPSLSKRDVQLFKKRLRKECARVCERGSQVRYYTVGEYGTRTNRPHYHSILFNVPLSVYVDLEKIWTHGGIYLGDVSPASIAYTAKYHVNKIGNYEHVEQPFALMSRRPGIGANYLATHGDYHRRLMSGVARINGGYTRLPRYYRDRIFDEDQRSQLYVEAVQHSTRQLHQELARLTAYHQDPYYYYAEMVKYHNDHVKHKSNVNSKF